MITMAVSLIPSLCSSLFIFFASLSCLTHASFDSELKRSFATDANWFPAGATWYGSPDGAGSDGGACGYGSAVGEAPFSSMVAAGGPSLFKYGKGCGACYQVKCTEKESMACSGLPVSVVITDECPGGPCLAESIHFDLSGAAFGAMALPGRADALRNVGLLQIQYRRVACEYPGWNLTFHVDLGSNPYYFSVVIEFEDSDGDLASVDLAEGSVSSTASDPWLPMQHSWGANWVLNSGLPLQAPFSLRLTSLGSGKTVVASNVIPPGWQPGASYHALVNYH